MQPTWTQNPTRLVRRDRVQPGMIVHSSHGYRLLVTEVLDNAVNRVPDRHVQITGHLHADPNNSTRNERYEAHSYVPVETDTVPARQEQATDRMRATLAAPVAGMAGYGVADPLDGQWGDYLSDGYDTPGDATTAARCALVISYNRGVDMDRAAELAANVYDLADWDGEYDRLRHHLQLWERQLAL